MYHRNLVSRQPDSRRRCANPLCNVYMNCNSSKIYVVKGLKFDVSGSVEFLGCCTHCVRESLERDCLKWLNHRGQFVNVGEKSNLTIDWFQFFAVLKTSEKKEFLKFLKYLGLLVKKPVRNRRIEIRGSVFGNQLDREDYFASASLAKKISKEMAKWRYVKSL